MENVCTQSAMEKKNPSVLKAVKLAGTITEEATSWFLNSTHVAAVVTTTAATVYFAGALSPYVPVIDRLFPSLAPFSGSPYFSQW